MVFCLLLSACNLQFLSYPEGSPADLGPSWTTFENQYFSISYPIEWKVQVENMNVIFKSPDEKKEVVAIVQEDIPRVALVDKMIEDTRWGKLYHDKDPKTGTENIDKLITDIPGSKQDFYLAGYGEIFDKMLLSLKLKQQDELINVSIYFGNNNAELFSPLASREISKDDKYWEILELLREGPNEEEQQAGAINLFDSSVVLEDLKLDEGVAHVYYTGNLCNVLGSAFNVGELVNKTLKQFTEIKYVKIYLDGETQEPSGLSDSIPVCLEP